MPRLNVLKIFAIIISLIVLESCALPRFPGSYRTRRYTKYRRYKVVDRSRQFSNDLKKPYQINANRNPFNYYVANTYHSALKFPHPKGKGLCYRYVKCALLEGGLVSYYIPGRFAKNAASQLAKIPFFRQLYSQPTDLAALRRGSVIVYEPHDSNENYGHIEIKVAQKGQHGYVSDFFHEGVQTAGVIAIFEPRYNTFRRKNRIRTETEKRNCRLR